MTGPSFAEAVLILAKYQYQIAFVADQEINLLAALTEMMVECECQCRVMLVCSVCVCVFEHLNT